MRANQLSDILERVNGFESIEEAAPAKHILDQARDPARRVRPLDAAGVWQALIAGRWSLVEQFDSDGDRCFVAVKNGPERPGRPALSERERQIVALASLGHSNKVIGYEVGLSSSAVAAQLTSAARKVGVSSSKTLLHAFAVLGGQPAEPGAPKNDNGPAGRRDAAPVQVTQFLHDGQEFAMIRIGTTPNLPKTLTAAEREVATMVIEGLSNADIAGRRETSVRTVANQLRSIYSKLEVGSRRQLRSRF